MTPLSPREEGEYEHFAANQEQVEVDRATLAKKTFTQLSREERDRKVVVTLPYGVLLYGSEALATMAENAERLPERLMNNDTKLRAMMWKIAASCIKDELDKT